MSVQTLRCMNFWRGSYHNSTTSPDGTAPHRNVLSVYGFLAERRKKDAEPTVITAQTSRACRTPSVSLTYATSPTAFSVGNLHRYGKLPVDQETIDRSARTPLFKSSTLEHIIGVSFHLWLILSVKRLVPSDRLLCFFCTCPLCSNRVVRLWEQSWDDFPAGWRRC